MPTTTGSFAGIYDSQIVSGFDIHKPEYLDKLFERYGDQGQSFFMKLRLMGFEKTVAQDTYYHFEDGLKNPTFHARALVAAPGTGNPMNITLAVADLDAANNFYPRLYDIVNFKGGQQGQIMSINVGTPSAPVLTIYPMKSTAALPGVAAGEEISIVSDAFSEGSGQPKGAVTEPWRYENDMQIIKETIGVTGTELTNQAWVTIGGNGTPVSYYNVDMTSVEYRLQLKGSGALLTGERSDGNRIDPTTNRPILTTEGLIPYIRRTGNIKNYTPGAFAVTDFDAMAKTLDREYAGNVIASMLGIDFHNEIENSLYSYLQNTNVVFAKDMFNAALPNASLSGNDNSKGVNINFSYLLKSERVFGLTRMAEFSNRQTLGITGSNYPKMGVFIPLGQKKNLSTGTLDDKIGVRVKALNGYNRKMEVWDVRGAGPGLKVSQFDEANTYYRMNIGAHFMAGNQFILVEPS